MKNGSMVRDQFERRRPVLIALIATVLLAGVVVAAGQRGDDEERAIGGEVAGPTGARTDGETPPSSNSDSGALDGVLADGTSTNNAPAPGGGGSVPGVQPEPGTGPEGAAVSSGPLPVGADVHGVTDTAIQIGLITSDIGSVRALGPVFGTGDGGSDPTGDYDKANAAAVDLVNSMGGIAGRKVEPVYYFYNPSAIATASGRQQENQAACARWTEDNHVFAMWGGATTDESLMQCAVDTKTPMLLIDRKSVV